MGCPPPLHMPLCWAPPRKSGTGACVGPAAPVSPVPGATYAYNGGIVAWLGVNGFDGGVVLDPPLELFSDIGVPGSNPPCCLSGSNLTYQWVAEGGPVEWNWEFAQTSADPLLWQFSVAAGTPGFTFTRTHWLVVRYCTCGQPTVWGIQVWADDTEPYNPPDLPAYVALLEGLGVTFTTCP